MLIKTIKVSEINPANYNPRKDLKPEDSEYKKLRKSILEFDLVEPLVYNQRSGNLIGGHQRLKILKELGIEEVEVSVVDLDDEKEKALNLALNKIQGSWDLLKLKDLLEELDTGNFDIEITGFDNVEIEELKMQLFEPAEGLIDDDEIPEEVETVCKTGDLWQLGNHRLLCGDSTKKDDIERLMGGEKADIVFTDPPYGINIIKGIKGKIGYENLGKIGTSKLYKTVIGDDIKFDPNFLLSLNMPLILFGANYYADLLPCKSGWLVWDNRTGETIHRTTFADCELIWTSFDSPARLYRHLWDGMVRAGNRNDELKDRVHPTQKPVGLCVQILQDYKGVSVFDPFGGSGSTLIACEKLSRRCFMMEIDEYYASIILSRWANFTGKDPIREDGARLSDLLSV